MAVLTKKTKENKERRDFEKRIKYLNKTLIADYKGVRLTSPLQDQGVFSLYMQLSQIEKKLRKKYEWSR